MVHAFSTLRSVPSQCVAEVELNLPRKKMRRDKKEIESLKERIRVE